MDSDDLDAPDQITGVPRDVIEVTPNTGPVSMDARPPGSKSITNRALVCAALASGRTDLRGALFADDTLAMIGCLRSLGIGIEVDHRENTIAVTGCAGERGGHPADLDAKLSGTTARFIAPVAALVSPSALLDGDEPLRRRPMSDLFDAIRTLGGHIESLGDLDHLPVRIEGAAMRGGVVEVGGDVSSQFLSALLLSGPAMELGLDVMVSTPLVSHPYVDMTLSVMTEFGARWQTTGGGRFNVKPGGYTSVDDYEIEPDASAASYFLAAAAICGGRTRIVGLGRGSLQGDIRFADVLGQMGMEVRWSDDSVEVERVGELTGVDIDMSDISDVAQTLAVVATMATSPTRVRGIGFIRHKETDRVAAVVTELRRLGIDAIEHDDGFIVNPGTPIPGEVRTYDDHRMAMSFALLGLRYQGIRILDPHCVAKTYPAFWHDFGQV